MMPETVFGQVLLGVVIAIGVASFVGLLILGWKPWLPGM